MMIGAARIQTTHVNLIIMSPKAVVSKIKIDNHCTDTGVKGPGGIFFDDNEHVHPWDARGS